MASAENRQLIQDYFDALTGKSTATPFEHFFSDDVVWHIPQSNPVITPNPRRGRAAVMDLLAAGVDTYQAGSMQIVLHRLVADDEHVVAQFDLNAVLANGNSYANNYLFLFSIRGGRIAAVWEYLDTLYQAQRGSFDLVPEPGE